MKSKFIATSLKQTNKKIDSISKLRLGVGLTILICWFYPVIFNSGLAIFYPLSILFIVGFITLVYKSTRFKEFKDYLIQRERLEDRRDAQIRTDFKYTPDELSKWQALLAKIHVDKSAHWDDLDLVKSNGLLQSLHSTGNAESLQFLADLLKRGPLSLAEIQRRQLCVHIVSLGPRRKALTILTMNPDVQSLPSTQLLLKESLVETSILVPITYAYYFLLWTSYAWYLTTGGTLYGVLLLGLFFLFPLVNRRVKISKTYNWVVGFEAQLARMQKVKKVIRFYSQKAQQEKSSLLSSFLESETGLSFDRALRELNKIIGAMGLRQNFILYGIIHTLVPWDFYWTVRAESLRLKLEAVYMRWLQDLMEFEAYAMLAEYSQNIVNSTWPEIKPGAATLKAIDLSHPLIPVQVMVPNDVELNPIDKKCLLVTGSNMSGKSTFLRTLGINLMLMRMGSKVHARVFESSPFQVLTSLKRVDSLEESLSTFYSEVKNLKDIRDESISHLSLYLIDEIFRGTNNRERLIGAQKYIKALLQSPSLGLVTTHDLELSQMDQDYKNLVNEHFADSIENGKMVFDYKKKMGPCPSTNALKVMEMEGVF